MKYFLAASLICGDPLKIFEEIKELEKANIDFLHFDVMDGHFVPRIGLYPEMLTAIKKVTNIPIDVHLMLDEPEKYIPVFAKAGADYIAIHTEAKGDLLSNIKMIKECGVKAGAVLKVETDVSVLDSVIHELDLVELMAIRPGILGQKMLPETLDRIKAVSGKIKDYKNILIEIDGGVTPETAPEMVKMGANLLVCGTGTIYRPHEDTLYNKVHALRKTIDESIYGL